MVFGFVCNYNRSNPLVTVVNKRFNLKTLKRISNSLSKRGLQYSLYCADNQGRTWLKLNVRRKSDVHKSSNPEK